MSINKKITKKFRKEYLPHHNYIDDILSVNCHIDQDSNVKYVFSFNLRKEWIKLHLPRVYHKKGRSFFVSDRFGHFQHINVETKNIDTKLTSHVKEILSSTEGVTPSPYPIEIQYFL